MMRTPSEHGDSWVLPEATAILERTGILRNPFFTALSSGAMTREEFTNSQRQFYFAVLEFSRPMLWLMARLPLPEQRLGLLDNVLEEHGDFDSARFHAATFRRFCGSLGIGESALDEDRPGPAVTAFNLALWGLCQTETPETAFACLGIIELAFAHISAMIGNTIVERGWLPAERLVHYRLHAELDVEHATELFAPLRGFADDAPVRQVIVAGLELGAYLFDRLYRDLALKTAIRIPKLETNAE